MNQTSMSTQVSAAQTFSPTQYFSTQGHVNSLEQYEQMYAQSIQDPDKFWTEIAEQFEWNKKWTRVHSCDFKDKIDIKWFIDGKTNITVNCLDRHLETRGDQTAIIWEGNEPGEDEKFTYRQLHRDVCKFANALKALGAKKGDRITLYMPMIPEAAMAMLQ